MSPPDTHQPSLQRGQTMLVAVFFFIVISLLIILGMAEPILRQATQARSALLSEQSYYLAESLNEDVTYRLKNGMDVDTTETITIDNETASATVSDTLNGKKVISRAAWSSRFRSVKTILQEGDGVAFNYGLQSGEGGIELENTASVIGNAYSNGEIVGEGNMVEGTAISAGPSGRVHDIHATGSVYAHTIEDSWIEGDAYYFATTTITNTTVEGTRYPESEDQATTSLPISDSQIDEWRADAEAGDINDCNGKSELDIHNEDITLGPEKIDCDLRIRGNNMTVDVAGPIWVEGDISVKNGPTVRVDDSLGSKSVAIIADEPSRTGSGAQIDLDNKGNYVGGDGNSHLLFISQNDNAEQGGSKIAINVANNMDGDVLIYAGHGEIMIRNSIDVHGATAYRIHARNDAKVVYQQGLADLLFDTGPSGSFTIQAWEEVK